MYKMYIRLWLILPVLQIVSALIPWDGNCGVTKGCFPYCPDGCKYLVTWQHSTTSVAFTMQAEETDPNTYLAIGFSDDRRMGDDSVVACSVKDSTMHSYYNNDDDSEILSPNGLGLSNDIFSHVNGVMYCSFTRTMNEPNIHYFDLNNPFILMLVVGEMETKHGVNEIKKHYMIPWSSDSKVDFRSNTVYNEYKLNSPLVKLHGIMMSFAWLFFCTVGIITARYNKDMLPRHKLLGTKIWFQVHRGAMVFILVAVIIAFISIFVENKGYSQITPPKSREAVSAHPVLGIIVTVLCFANPIMAMFRPDADHKLRWLFNWVHLGVGVLAQLLAVVTIMLGYFLDRAMLPISVVYVTVVHILVFVSICVFLEIYKWKTKRGTKSSTEPSTVAFIGLVIYTVLALVFIIGIVSIIGGS